MGKMILPNQRFLLTLSILSMLVLTSFTIMGPGSVLGDTNRLIEKDDWTVIGAETVSDETILMTGNLTIGPGGVLRLVNTDLEVNLSYDAEFNIQVDNGGTLELVNSTISSISSGSGYNITVSGTLSCDQASLEDYKTIRFIDSNSSLNFTDMVNGGSISVMSSDVSLLSSNIIVDSGGTALIVDDSIVIMTSTIMRNTATSSSEAMNISGASTVTLEDGGIYNFTTGIYAHSYKLIIDGTHIEGSKEVGIYQETGRVQLSNARFVNNVEGLHCQNGFVTIENSEFHAKDVQTDTTGMELRACDVDITNSMVRDTSTGIRSLNSVVDILDNMIRDNGIGLDWTDSNNGVIKGTTFFTNDKGAIFRSVSKTLEDCQFSNTVADIEVEGGTVDLINTTYSKEIIDPSSSMTVHWYLSIYIETASGAPAGGAKGEVVDNQGEILVFDADMDGNVGPNLLKEKTITRYHVTRYSPYNISARLGSEKARTIVDLNGSGTVTLTLGETDLYILDVRTNKTDIIVNEWAQVIITIGATTNPIYGVDIFLFVEGQLSTNSSVDIIQDLTEVSFPFMASSMGDYEIKVVIDPNFLIDEANETNNEAVMIVRVGNGSSNGGGGTDKPDLQMMTLSQSNANPFAGSVITMTVEVQNSGEAEAENVPVRLYIDNGLIGSRTIRRIGAGSMGRATFDWEAQEGNHTVRVEIDPENTIEESNEFNNVYESDINVGGRGTDPLPDDLDGLVAICLMIIIIFIVIIVVLLVLMTKKPKAPVMYQHQKTALNQNPGLNYPATRTKVIPASIKPKSPRATRIAGATTIQPQGSIRCKRCGGSNIKFFDDGHKLCKDCRKIFF